MQIQTNKNGELEVRTKKTTVVFDHKTKVNEVELEGTGEYEIGGVVIDGIDDDIYVFQMEDMILGSVNFKGKISKEHLERLSSAEVLIVRLDGNVPQAVEQANQIEPNILVYAGDSETKSKIKSSGVTATDEEILKITKADIGESKAYFITLRQNTPQPAAGINGKDDAPKL